MAEVDDFFLLREFDSLNRENESTQQKIRDEEERIKRRANELAQRKEQLSAREQSYKEMTHQIAELDRRLLQHLSPEMKAQLEEQGLELMTQQDQIDELIKEDKTFIVGYQKTLLELTSEIESEIQILKNKILTHQKRLDSLLPTINPEWMEKYQKIRAKKLSHGSFSTLEGLHCKFCRHTVSKEFQSDVDVKLQLKSCPGCSRLILPYKAVAG
ncbi:MAG: hypothetical protein K2P81_06540 [Bacteriovoracaceae bacterium]|nr:hypothetical protein [Bacteriovoracaceae bacterium]